MTALRDTTFDRPRLPGVLRTLEGLVLLGLGLFMILLAAVGPYWSFLNPKFAWLTVSTGGVLVLLGVLHPFLGARPRVLRLVVLSAFLCMAVHAAIRAESDLTQPAPQETSLGREVDPQAQWANSREIQDGREYVRLNLAELFLVAQDPHHTPPERFVTLGLARRTPALDAAGEFALVRMSVVCCLADAVAPGFPVRMHAAQRASAPADGSWVRVYGRLEPLPKGAPQGDGVSLPGVIGTFISQEWRIVPDRVEPTDPPEIPFIFEINDTEPFAN